MRPRSGISRSLFGAASIAALGLALAPCSPSDALSSEAVHISFASESQPIINVPEAITVAGTSPSAATLLVYTIAGQKECPSKGPSGAGESVEAVLGTPNIASTPIAAGSFSHTYSMSFAQLGVTAVCAYLGATFPEDKTWGDAMDWAWVEAQSPAPHLTALKVMLRSHAGSTASKPGRTELIVQAMGGGELHLTLKRRGRTRIENLGYRSAGRFVVPWSCSSPGGVYVYTVTATDEYGKTLTHSGMFHPVSAARCRALRIADERRRSQEERQHREQEAGRGQEEERLEREVEQIKHDQRVACEQGLGGRVERVNESIEIPPVPKDTETECEVSGRTVTLKGDPPEVVSVNP